MLDIVSKEGQVKSRPEKIASWGNRRRQRKATEKEHDAILKLVREGVRRFILKDAPIGDFQKAIRVAARKGLESTHPLTGPVFRRIVKAAIRERGRNTAGQQSEDPLLRQRNKIS